MSTGNNRFIRNVEMNVAMIQATSPIKGFYNGRNVNCIICCMRIHHVWVGIKVIITGSSHQSLNACRKLIRKLGYLISIEACRIVSVSNITEATWLINKTLPYDLIIPPFSPEKVPFEPLISVPCRELMIGRFTASK